MMIERIRMSDEVESIVTDMKETEWCMLRFVFSDGRRVYQVKIEAGQDRHDVAEMLRELASEMS